MSHITFLQSDIQIFTCEPILVNKTLQFFFKFYSNDNVMPVTFLKKILKNVTGITFQISNWLYEKKT